MRRIGISEFKARCIQLLTEVQETQTPLIVTYRGKPVARIEPIPSTTRRKLGALRHLGQIRTDLVGRDFDSEWEI